MAIDTMVYCAHVPAGTYNAGDRIPMNLVRGPTVVRDGYGSAYMKRMISFSTGVGGGMITRAVVKNSNWVDEMSNFFTSVSGSMVATSLASVGPNVQRCGDMQLQPNTAFDVSVECVTTFTTTTAYDFYVLIDVDFPGVSAVANPKNENGAPVTIGHSATVQTVSPGSDLVWTRYSVDLFKAGYKYLISELAVSATDNGSNQVGFFAISGASGMSGLCQIIPCIVRPMGAIRLEYEYSTVFVKGPMTIEYAVLDINGTAGTEPVFLEMDCIKR